MRALVVTAFGSPDTLQWRDVPEPEPERDEVLVAVDAVAVDWADVIKRRGTYPGGPQPPFVSGHNFVGRVLRAAETGEGPAIGDRVFGAVPSCGMVAERAAVPARLLHPAPDSLVDVEVAGLAGSYFTAWLAVRTYGRLKPGEAVLVQAGAGAFGSACIDLARSRGAHPVVATAGGEDKIEVLRQLGVDAAVDYSVEDVVAAVEDATGGRGVDLLCESVGGEVLEASLSCLRPFGRLVSVGASSGRSTRRFRLHTLFETGISVAGFSVGHLLATRPELVEDAATQVLAAADRGDLAPLVGQVVQAADAVGAHRRIEARRSVGRTVIAMTDTALASATTDPRAKPMWSGARGAS